MLLSRQLEIWERDGKWDKIRQAIEKIKPEGRTAQMDLLLSSVYLQQPDIQKDRKKLAKVVRMLAPHNPLKKDDTQWCLNINMALTLLNRFGESFPYLAKLMVLDKALFSPDAPEEFKNRLEMCQLFSRRPPFREPFQDRVIIAWKEFEKKEASLRNRLNRAKNEKAIQQIELDCEDILNMAIDGVSVKLSKIDGQRCQMVLTESEIVNKSFMELLAEEYFKEHCPATLLDKWDIIVGQASTLSEDSIVHDSENAYENAKIWIEESLGVFSLDFYPQNSITFKQRFPGEKEIDAVGRFFAFTTFLLNELLGEIVTLKCIRMKNLWTKPLDKPSYSFSDLPSFLLKQGIDVHADAKTLLNKEIEYRRTPTNKGKRSIIREDIIYGKTICGKILLDFEQRDETEINRLEANGATAGYIYYGFDNFEGPNREEEINKFRAFVKKSLMEKFNESELKIIGEAHGEQNDYIDIVLWNPNTVFDSLRLLFETFPIPYSAFHVFRRTTDGLVLTGESTFEKLFGYHVSMPSDIMKDFGKPKKEES